jgi:hypothetical protein
MEAKLNQDTGVAEMLRLLDLDRDGVLARREVRDALQRVDMIVSEDDIDEMMRACDRGEKGYVTLADLEAMFSGAGVDASLASPAPRQTVLTSPNSGGSAARTPGGSLASRLRGTRKG